MAIVCRYLMYHMYWPLLLFTIQKTFHSTFLYSCCNWFTVETMALHTYLTHSMDPDFGQCDNRVWNES